MFSQYFLFYCVHVLWCVLCVCLCVCVCCCCYESQCHVTPTVLGRKKKMNPWAGGVAQKLRVYLCAIASPQETPHPHKLKSFGGFPVHHFQNLCLVWFYSKSLPQCWCLGVAIICSGSTLNLFVVDKCPVWDIDKGSDGQWALWSPRKPLQKLQAWDSAVHYLHGYTCSGTQALRTFGTSSEVTTEHPDQFLDLSCFSGMVNHRLSHIHIKAPWAIY